MVTKPARAKRKPVSKASLAWILAQLKGLNRQLDALQRHVEAIKAGTEVR